MWSRAHSARQRLPSGDKDRIDTVSNVRRGNADLDIRRDAHTDVLVAVRQVRPERSHAERPAAGQCTIDGIPGAARGPLPDQERATRFSQRYGEILSRAARNAAGENGDRVVHTSIDDFFTHAPRDNPYGETFETWTIHANVSVYKELAQAWVWYGARLDDSGEVAEWDGVDAFTFLKHDGVWKIAALMFASGDP